MNTLVAHRVLFQATVLLTLTGSAMALGSPSAGAGGDPVEHPGTSPAPFPTRPVAQDMDGDSWSFRVAPYLWTAGIDGNLTSGLVDVDFDFDFGDI